MIAMEAKALWIRENDAGNGFALGEPDESPDEALEAQGCEVIYRAQSSDDVSVGVLGPHVYIVADANGPWAVCIKSEASLPVTGKVLVTF